MSTTPINPMPFDGPERDPDTDAENDPDLATPDVTTRPDDDSPLIESGEPSSDTASDDDPDDQLLRDPGA
ncbi:MAG TPA: hypothetical protein VFT31_06425 [Kribbella sp.]|nr:hypothetical protein [Kribbella sp.]